MLQGIRLSRMARVYNQGDQRAGKDGLLKDRQAHILGPWRQTHQLSLGLQTKILRWQLEPHRAGLVALGYQQGKRRDYVESFPPICSHSTIRLVFAFAAGPGRYSLDLDAVCAFISSDLAPGERVYMKGPAGYNIGESNCMYMLKCIYGHVHVPRQYYMHCREVYQKAGLKQLHTDECVFIRYVSNIMIIGHKSSPTRTCLSTANFSTWMWCLRKCSSTSCAVIRWLL